ncbi:MAG: MMPL family transporter [Hymenobacter sp.]
MDANVLIFERIREELRPRPERARCRATRATRAAFSAIFDSNVTTMLIAMILGFFGTGPVQSFAITLGIGVLTSFLSAVYVSRLIIECLIKGKEDQRHHVLARSSRATCSRT